MWLPAVVGSGYEPLNDILDSGISITGVAVLVIAKIVGRITERLLGARAATLRRGLSHRRLGGAPRWLSRGDFEPMVSGRTIVSSFALGQDRRVQETHRYKAESHAIMSAATELFRAGAQLPEEKTRSPRRDDLATVKLRAITEVRRDAT